VRSELGWEEDPPDWRGGKDCHFLMNDGRVVFGSWDLKDSWFTGEESVPVWNVILRSGQPCNFWDDVKGWRPVEIDPLAARFREPHRGWPHVEIYVLYPDGSENRVIQ
jgi:hypothetical protein